MQENHKDPFGEIFGDGENDELGIPDQIVFNGPADASSAVAEVKRLKDKVAEIEEIGKTEIERIKNWMAQETNRIATRCLQYEVPLKFFLRDMKAIDPKYVLKTPYGTAYLTQPAPKWNWENDDNLVQLLKDTAREDLIRTKLEPDKNAIKKAFTVITMPDGKVVAVNQDGEVFEGAIIEEQEDKMVFKFLDQLPLRFTYKKDAA